MFYVRVISTGEVLGAANSTPQDDEWEQRYAAALDISEPVEQFEASRDPRRLDARVEAQPDQTQPPTIEEKYAALLAVVQKLAPDAVAASPVLSQGE
jgi:predicted Zn-dependent protease